MKKLLSEAEKSQVAEAVAQAERKTAGEIVPVVVRRSDDYPDASWRIAFTLALLAAFALTFFVPTLETTTVLWMQVPVAIIGYFLGSLPAVQRIFLNPTKMTQEVQQRALEAFHARGLHNSKGRTGILIFVSMLEHQVTVLADSGIHSRVPQGTWDQLVARLIEKIRAGQLAEGLVLAVAECGQTLSHEFPAGPEDVNELPNAPVIED